jgi:hypothetical protein
MTINSNTLSDRSRAIIETIRMRLTEKQSLEYLKEVGFDIGPATFYREKRQVEQMKLKRLYHIVKMGFQDQHLERIDQYEMGFKMMWQNVLRERDPYRQNAMIRDILLLQPYLSSYYEATKLVLEKKPDYKNESNKKQQQWQLQEEEDDEEEGKELNGDSYNDYQQQQESTTTLTNKESSKTELTTDYFYNNKNRKF